MNIRSLGNLGCLGNLGRLGSLPLDLPQENTQGSHVSHAILQLVARIPLRLTVCCEVWIFNTVYMLHFSYIDFNTCALLQHWRCS